MIVYRVSGLDSIGHAYFADYADAEKYRELIGQTDRKISAVVVNPERPHWLYKHDNAAAASTSEMGDRT